jgi:hypothetical protein
MIPAFLLEFAGRFVTSERGRKILAVAMALVAVAAVVGGCWAAWHHWFAKHDETVIQNDRTVSNAEIRNTQIDAERQVGADKIARDDQFATNQTEIKDTTDEAAHNGSSPLDALFDKLR